MDKETINMKNFVLEDDDPKLISEQKKQETYAIIEWGLTGGLLVLLVAGVFILCRELFQI